jgi:hypothetical protein
MCMRHASYTILLLSRLISVTRVMYCLSVYTAYRKNGYRVSCTLHDLFYGCCIEIPYTSVRL